MKKIFTVLVFSILCVASTFAQDRAAAIDAHRANLISIAEQYVAANPSDTQAITLVNNYNSLEGASYPQIRAAVKANNNHFNSVSSAYANANATFKAQLAAGIHGEAIARRQ